MLLYFGILYPNNCASLRRLHLMALLLFLLHYLPCPRISFTLNVTHNGQWGNYYYYYFLSLNPSKTEFLIIGLPQQLSKLNNPTIHLSNNVILSPVDSARNLGIIFDQICH